MTLLRPLAIALALTVAAAPALAQQQRVYQWKDANGVTHYADMPPTQTHKSRDIDNKSGNAAEVATLKTAESPQCLDARANLKRLQGGETLGIDTNGDGKSDRELSAQERSSQTELNLAAVKAYCPSSKP